MERTLPPLPSYHLEPLPSLISGIPDNYLSLALLVAVYWGTSLFFHVIDTYDLFPQCRLHTPEELVKRNHASRWEVFRDVLVQQFVQTLFGLALGVMEESPLTGKEGYDVAVWAQRLRIAQHALPSVLAVTGVNAPALSKSIAASHPTLSGVLAGGIYYGQDQNTFASWELATAKFIYWLLIPSLQFVGAILVLDTWQYFWHRAMHMNKFMYSKSATNEPLLANPNKSLAAWHSRHHRLYVPYAYGALYNHPVEGFIFDTLGAGVAYLSMGMTTRQAMCFFVFSTIKTVDDHSGYVLPFDPLQYFFPNNASYHDIHHQSWGIKTNFEQPYFTFWDKWLGTMYKGDTSLRYERDRKAMERRAAMDAKAVTASTQPIKIEKSVLQSIEQTPLSPVEEEPVPEVLRRSPRKRTHTPSLSQSSSGAFAAPIKELRNRMNTSLHGTSSGVLGYESTH